MTTLASTTPRRRPRALSLVLLAVLTLGATVMALVVNQVVDDQEHRLLDQQAQAAGALTTSVFGGSLATYPLLGDLAVTPGAEQFFTSVAQPLVASGATVGVARREPAGLTIVRVEGKPLAGSTLDARMTALVQRATAVNGLVSDVMPIDAQNRRLMFAARSLSRADVVTFSDFRLSDALLRAASSGPFGELDGAIYVGTRADPDHILMATRKMPLSSGPIARVPLTVGADKWLIVVKAKHALVGDFAARLPWLVFAGGMIAALLATALVELVSRRRAYAMRLVDERTHDLALATQAAEEANRSKSEFLSRMSHELRTPLNAVLGFAQLLESDDLTPEQHESIRQIIGGGRHLLDLINEVLDITRIETGTFQLSPEAVMVDDVVDDVLELTRPLAAAGNIELSRRAEGCEVHVLADRQRLKQILLNLVANAVKYNHPGGRVSVSCRRDEASSTLRINVRDTGPGIRPEHLALLFTPFERLGAERTDVEGTGVGLALSRRLAEAMGGRVDVDTTFGDGSTFWVELPLAESPLARLDASDDVAAPVDVADGAERRTVLYIEDNLSNLRLVEQIFARRADIELLTARKGQLGLEVARDRRPALVLLDLHLPDLGGDEVLRELRSDSRTSAIPVVMISADATPAQGRRMVANGAHAYLTKPLDVTELRRVVDDVFEMA